MVLRERKYSRLLVAALAAVIALPTGPYGQAPAGIPDEPQLTLSQVVENLVYRNAERAKNLRNYRATRTYDLDYKGFPTGLHAEMTVDMRYNAPDRKEFRIVSESGTKWVVKHVLERLIETEAEAQKPTNRASVELTTQNYEFTSLEHKPSADGCSYVLSVRPKIPSKFLYRGRIWIHDQDFAVCRIEAEPAKNPSMWIMKTEINHHYQKIGDFWLPLDNQSVSSMRVGGRAILVIKYRNYEINNCCP